MRLACLLVPIILAAVLGPAAPVMAAEIRASCDDHGLMNVRVHFYQSDLQAGWVGAMVSRTAVGACLPPVFLAEDPLIIPAGESGLDVTLADPGCLQEFANRYQVWGVDAQGLPHALPVGDGPFTYDVATCAEAPLMRGRLLPGSVPYQVGIELCSDSCWEFCTGDRTIGISALAPAEYVPYVGTDAIVQIYGVFSVSSPENSDGCVHATRIVAVADCLGTVGAASGSWGALKSDYR